MKAKDKKDILKGLWKLSCFLNDDRDIEELLAYGVADGDDLEDDDDMSLYVGDEDHKKDEDFFELIGTYVHVLERARKHGGFWDAETGKVF